MPPKRSPWFVGNISTKTENSCSLMRTPGVQLLTHSGVHTLGMVDAGTLPQFLNHKNVVLRCRETLHTHLPTKHLLGLCKSLVLARTYLESSTYDFNPATISFNKASRYFPVLSRGPLIADTPSLFLIIFQQARAPRDLCTGVHALYLPLLQHMRDCCGMNSCAWIIWRLDDSLYFLCVIVFCFLSMCIVVCVAISIECIQ